jgi:hypothetical protein
MLDRGVLPKPLPAAPLVVCRRYSAVVPKPLPAAPRRFRSRRRTPRQMYSGKKKYYQFYLHSDKVALAAKAPMTRSSRRYTIGEFEALALP